VTVKLIGSKFPSIEVNEAIVDRCDQGVGHRMSEPHQAALSAFQSTPQARSRAYLNQQPCTELNQIYDDGQE
jgi:hypothetical protein